MDQGSDVLLDSGVEELFEVENGRGIRRHRYAFLERDLYVTELEGRPPALMRDVCQLVVWVGDGNEDVGRRF